MHTAADHLRTVFLVGAHQTGVVVDGVILVDHRAGCAVGAQKLRHKYDTSTSQMCAWRGTRYLLGAGKHASALALPLRLRPVPASAPALEVREVRDDRPLQRREAALRSELGQSPHIRHRADFRPTHDGVLERLHLHLPLAAPRLAHFNLPQHAFPSDDVHLQQGLRDAHVAAADNPSFLRGRDDLILVDTLLGSRGQRRAVQGGLL